MLNTVVLNKDSETKQSRSNATAIYKFCSGKSNYDVTSMTEQKYYTIYMLISKTFQSK